jgi:ABC-type polysaccharide/polyol phosphate export permease
MTTIVSLVPLLLALVLFVTHVGAFLIGTLCEYVRKQREDRKQ